MKIYIGYANCWSPSNLIEELLRSEQWGDVDPVEFEIHYGYDYHDNESAKLLGLTDNTTNWCWVSLQCTT